MDHYWPTTTQTVQGENYFMLLIIDDSRMKWVAFLKEKYEAFEKFKAFKASVKNETDLKIKCLRLDRGGGFISNDFEGFCKLNRIKRLFSTTTTPWHNGVVERKN